MIRWITPRLGTAPFASIEDRDDVVLIDVRDLPDREGNPPDVPMKWIRQAIEALREGRRVVLGCDVGISRSNAVAAGVLSVAEDIPFDEAVQNVIRATGEAFIKLEVLASIRQALDILRGAPARRAPSPDSSRPRTAVVIGGRGFVGSAVLQELQHRIPVLTPTRADLDVYEDAFALDCLVRKSRATDILCLDDPPVSNVPAAYGQSLGLLRNVVSVSREHGLRIVYLSCANVFSGHTENPGPFSETAPPRPAEIPGEVNFLCETLLETFCTQNALPYTLIRSARLYGADRRKPPFLLRMISRAFRNEPIVTHHFQNGPPNLDMLHLRDFTRALVGLVVGNYTGTYHLGAGRAISTREMAKQIVAIIGSTSTLETVQIPRRHIDVLLDCRKAQSELHWTPEVSIEQGLTELISLVNGTT